MSAVREEMHDGVYRITFNRPEKRNAFNFELLSDFYRSLHRAEEEKSTVVIIRGSGGAFSSGGDLGEFRVSDRERIAAGMDLLNKSIMLIRSLNAIVIAVLEGAVAGAAVGLSLACDLSVAAQNAYINLGFRRVGLAVDGAASTLLPKIIGTKRSNELFLFARNVNMDEAKSIGLVNFVLESEGFEDELEKMIAEVKKLPVEPIKHFKALTNKAVFSDLEAQLKQEQEANCTLFSEPSFKARLETMFARK